MQLTKNLKGLYSPFAFGHLCRWPQKDSLSHLFQKAPDKVILYIQETTAKTNQTQQPGYTTTIRGTVIS